MLLVLLALCLCFTAGAAALTERVSFPDIHATCEVDESYILLKPDNLGLHQEWLENHDITEADLLADWKERGVLMQAWTTSGDACLEITAVQDAMGQQYIDIDELTPAIRGTYRNEHLKGSGFKALGYTYQSAEWKKTKQGRFLMLKYKRTVGGDTYRGYARRTIKMGYTITLDYQVFGRNLTAKDNNALNKVWNSWEFSSTTATTLADGSPAIITNLKFTAQPPAETSTGKFSVTGTCKAGLRLVGVLMRMNGTEPLRVETTANKSGKFTLPVQLPQEGVWLMAVTVFSGDTVADEMVFSTTTYSKTLLTVNLDQPLPTVLSGDTYTVSGTTVKQTKVQMIVEGPSPYTKMVTVNNSGKFSFKIPTAVEGEYRFSLVFEKKGYTTRRITSNATRKLTELDIRTAAMSKAIKPAYTQLTKRVDGYVGDIMTYELFITDVQRSSSNWVIFGAMRSTNSGYKDIVVVLCPEDPGFKVGDKHRVYGTLTGTYLVQNSEEGDAAYPCFDLIFWSE